ncbi:hypothetical protein C8J56DRAFT_927001 [Mycena floridula]|nr:hypothetical protein C8J56DRAFT_927001 [Mycena floridula]
MGESVIEIHVQDTSPTLTYFPFGDTFSTVDLQAGWNPYFTGSGFVTTPGQVGQGTSAHITSKDEASVSVVFTGTGIQLLGNVTQASFSLLLDGQSFTQAAPDVTEPNLLVAISNLSNSQHTLALITHITKSTSMVVLESATITSPPPSDPGQSQFTLQPLNDSVINFRGQWSFQNDVTPFRSSTTAGATASTMFLGTAFEIFGTTSPEAGNYTVNLDGITTQFSARSSFKQDDALLFRASGLDPVVAHRIEISNLDGSTLVLPLGGFKSFASGDPNPTPSPSPPSSPPLVTTTTTIYSKGTIAALVLAGILAFLLLSGSLFFLLVVRPRRRKMRQQRRDRREQRRKDRGMVLDITHDDPLGSQRNSRRTGFARWKHEVEGGALGLTDIGLAFRHSDDKYDQNFDVEEYVDETPRSAKSFQFSPSISPKGKGKGRWLGSYRRQRSSPSFTLEFPPTQTPIQSRSESHSGISVLTSLEYMSTPDSQKLPSLVNFSNDSPPAPMSQTAQHSHEHIESRIQYPPQALSQDDRGSVRDFDDGLSVLGPASALLAIRSLSPRTSERSYTPSPKRRHKKDRKLLGSSPPPAEIDDQFLDLHDGTRRSRGSGISHVRFEDLSPSDGGESGTKEKQKQHQKSTFRLTPPAASNLRSRITSFLDFEAGSSDASVITSSDSSTKRRQRSRWSSTTVPSSMNPEHERNGSSGESNSRSQTQSFLSVGQSSQSHFPFPISLPASPHHPEGHRPSPPPSQAPGRDSDRVSGLHSHPLDMSLSAESPTDSVPVSISLSEMQFRQSDTEDAPVSGLPRHPPLPLTDSFQDLTTPRYPVAPQFRLSMTPTTPRNPEPRTRHPS